MNLDKSNDLTFAELHELMQCASRAESICLAYQLGLLRGAGCAKYKLSCDAHEMKGGE